MSSWGGSILAEVIHLGGLAGFLEAGMDGRCLIGDLLSSSLLGWSLYESRDRFGDGERPLSLLFCLGDGELPQTLSFCRGDCDLGE
jgi:hypothetical protein